MTDHRLEHWMDGYVRAWASNTAEDIRALFTEEAEYRTEPSAAPAIGVDAIIALWVEAADEPDDHTFSWHAIGADGDRHFVQGRTEYRDGPTYDNLWVVDLGADGRASAFTEWWMETGSAA